MQRIGEYIVTLTVCSMISGILLSCLKDGPLKKVLHLSCGIILIAAVLNPLLDISLDDLDFSSICFYTDATDIISRGENLAADARHTLIKEKLQTYILDKASSWDIPLDVEVILDIEGVPVQAKLSGKCSMEGKQKISDFLSDEIGIAKENQVWTG